ncbi:MAG: D-cysteine desulfhydrase [Thermoleophilaceae bacterium]|nr:D-cysteine desulfhydrase [Thermoleophilaceae bacterium]
MTPDRISLGTWPTPVEPAPRLAERLGLRPGDLWIKRDDLSGLGGGGNKVRKLEYLCARALADGATTLVTSGGPQSNHSRLTAAAAARLGLDAVLVLAADGPGAGGGNLALDALLGASIVWAGPVDDAGLEDAVERTAAALRDQGRRVAVLPLGGSDAVGARGYVDCAAELSQQVPDMAHAVVAVGSGGTMAGLVAALGPGRVLGVDVGATSDPERRVLGIAGALRRDAAPGGLRLRGDQVGSGYGLLTPAARAALRDAARFEGIVLDPVYTAKALAGLAAAVQDGDVRPGERTVFVHTGGLPGLFGHSVAAELRPDAG